MAKKLINISDEILEKIKLIAKKEKRNVNNQISYMLENSLNKSKIRQNLINSENSQSNNQIKKLDMLNEWVV